MRATGSPINPVDTSRANTTTFWLFWFPTATRLPVPSMLNCRGYIPPEGQICTQASVPSGRRRKVVRESEGRREPLGSGRWKEVLLRLEMMRKRLSG